MDGHFKLWLSGAIQRLVPFSAGRDGSGETVPTVSGRLAGAYAALHLRLDGGGF